MAEKNSVWDDFTNQYGLSKTLRFELKPIGKTLEHVKKKENQEGLNLIKEDEKRAEDYKKVKEIIDKYHKEFIEKSLAEVKFEREDLKDFYETYEEIKNFRKDKTGDEYKDLRKELFKKQKNFRDQIRKGIEKVEYFKDLFSENLIKKRLMEWIEDKNHDELEIKKKLISKFQNWTTYFKGFQDNRKNVYSEKEIPTSIIYRIVHDNLPKFLDNVSKFEKLKKYFEEGLDFGTIEEDLKKELEYFKVKKLEEIFSLSNFNKCLNQSGIDAFKFILGGKNIEGEKEKIKGVNEYVNLFSQKKGDKKIRSLKMAPLFKQILSDRESASFVLDKFEDDKEVIDDINKFHKELCEKDENQKNLFESIKESLESLKEDDLEKVYIKNDKSLTDISQFIFGHYYFIKDSLRYYCEEIKFPFKNKEKPTKKELDAIEEYIEKTNYFSVSELESCIKEYNKTLEEKKTEKENPVCDYFSDLKKKTFENKEIKILDNIKEKYEGVKEISDDAKNLKDNEEDVGKIKDFLDSISDLYRFVKPLYVSFRKKKNEEENQSDVLEKGRFYNEFDNKFEKLEEIISLYNKVRNYVTQKPYSVEKFKLNFENSTLAGGWDVNKETDNTAVLFKDKDLFYLGIMDKDHKNNIFKEIEESNGSDFYEKMVYRQIANPSKDVQNLMVIDGETKRKTGRKEGGVENIQLEDLKNKHLPNEINTIRINKNYLKSEESFNKKDLNKFIDYYKDRVKEYYSDFTFDFKPTDDYSDFNDFTNHIKYQAYKIIWQKIDKSYINELVDEGKLYLFKIWSKDFSKDSKGKKNLHTLYWEMLFDEENLKNIVYKLNGKAELFYRKKSIDAKITHPKNKPIKNKAPIKNEESKFKYDLIKDKRFTEDKFLFHCPITLNFKEKETGIPNDRFIETIRDNSDKINILSIDRGERHLAYYTLLDSKGKILCQKSFNVISDDSKRKVDYQKKLDDLQGDRNKARKNWKKIENIKELKEGYLSQVVHEISKLVIENNAIVVFEDLNFGFKRGRSKIEKQVYQKLEKTLIDKLNYLVFKDRPEKESGGLLKAYQLTSKFESFQKLGKQSGLIFYVPSHYTSKICPRTGFVNLLRPYYENKTKSQKFFKNFKSIKYNTEKEYFEFRFNYEDFGNIRNSFDKDWTVCSSGERLKRFRNKNNKWETEKINLNDELKRIFNENEIEFETGNELKEEICNKESAGFFKDLIDCLRLVLQMRNSEIGTDKDYFLSCVADENGKFFNSEEAKEDEPKNADANGAYNVGLKGLMILDKIKDSDEDKKPDLKIENKEFFEFVLDKIKRRVT